MPSNVLELFRKNIEEKLYELKISKSDLARRLKVTPQTISKLLNGSSLPGIDRVEAIANALGVTPAYLLANSAERDRLMGMALQAPTIPSFMEGVSRQLLAVERRLAAIEQAKVPSPQTSLAEDLEALARAGGFESAQAAIRAYDEEHGRPQAKKPHGNKGKKTSG